MYLAWITTGMKYFNKYCAIILLTLSVNLPAEAGLDRYTLLEKLDDWIIERKIDSLSNKIFCRASIKSHGTWFASRVRLNQSDKLVIPKDLDQSIIPNEVKLQEIKRVLNLCRKSFLYNILD